MYAMRYRKIGNPSMRSIAGKDHVSIVRSPQLSQNVCNRPTNTAMVNAKWIQGISRAPLVFRNLARRDAFPFLPKEILHVS